MPDPQEQGAMSPAVAALMQIKQARDLSMSNPAGTADSGNEFYVDKDMAPGIAKGDEVCVYGTVTKIGSQVSIQPSRVEKAAEEKTPEVDTSGVEQ